MSVAIGLPIRNDFIIEDNSRLKTARQVQVKITNFIDDQFFLYRFLTCFCRDGVLYW
jgi:hypothetical protein